jgi:L-aminopeptidase/D-esterase-like protein
MNNPWLETPTGKRRARALGIPFQGEPGPHNAITDVPHVEVGYRTLIRGEGPLIVGQGPVRTGVTAIHPRGRAGAGVPVFAGVHSLNGNGEMTGFVWIEECGRTELPIVLTNTHSVGLARDATLKWMLSRHPGRMPEWGLPVAAETYDGTLNDINGFHVTDGDVFMALDDSTGGALDEGSVGGGTGMVCYEFKGGSGTASRRVTLGDSPSMSGTVQGPLQGPVHGQVHGTVGAFVQANFGRRRQLTIAGLPVGCWLDEAAAWPELAHDQGVAPPSLLRPDADQGSIIAVIATDLPLLPHQLKRLARRCGLGVGRSGAIAGHGSGDIFLAFSTANRSFFERSDIGPHALEALPDACLSPVFGAVIEAVDEAILNALVANTDMVGRDGRKVFALPHEPIARWVQTFAQPSRA